MMSKIRVYFIEDCPYCIELKDGIERLKLPYDEIDVNKPENEQEWNYIFSITNSDLLPVIAIDNNLLVGDINFWSIDEAIELIVKLNK